MWSVRPRCQDWDITTAIVRECKEVFDRLNFILQTWRSSFTDEVKAHVHPMPLPGDYSFARSRLLSLSPIFTHLRDQINDIPQILGVEPECAIRRKKVEKTHK